MAATLNPETFFIYDFEQDKPQPANDFINEFANSLPEPPDPALQGPADPRYKQYLEEYGYKYKSSWGKTGKKKFVADLWVWNNSNGPTEYHFFGLFRNEFDEYFCGIAATHVVAVMDAVSRWGDLLQVSGGR